MPRGHLLLSHIFSIITVVFCFVLKVPQIIRLLRSRQATGINFNGILLELSSYTITMMYNFVNRHALLSYLEYPVIIIQEYVLIAFVMHFKGYSSAYFFMLFSFFTSISLAFALNLIPKFILTILLPLTTPVSAISKGMQLFEIVSKKDASSVSVLTWFLSFFTNATRIYTIYMDSADVHLLCNFAVSSILSGSVMAAAMYYQKRPPARPKTN